MAVVQPQNDATINYAKFVTSGLNTEAYSIWKVKNGYSGNYPNGTMLNGDDPK